jgi:bifunctional DNase/RNase
MEKKIELEIIALSHSITQNNSYAVVLGERKGARRMPIIIGPFEAQAIAAAMERMQPARPLTHDLIRNMCFEFNIELKEVLISNLIEGVFHATLVCDRLGESVQIDARTSDAIALAVRFECPIFVYEFIIEQAGIAMEETEKKASTKEKRGNEYARASLDKLNEMLSEAIDKEDYERAARIRDEINKRS